MYTKCTGKNKHKYIQKYGAECFSRGIVGCISVVRINDKYEGQNRAKHFPTIKYFPNVVVFYSSCNKSWYNIDG